MDFAALSDAVYTSRFTKGTKKRDGRANAHRARAHRAFDRIWKTGLMSRSDAYRWLSVQMGWPLDDTHMGMMKKADCEKVVRLSNEYLQKAPQDKPCARRAIKRRPIDYTGAFRPVNTEET